MAPRSGKIDALAFALCASITAFSLAFLYTSLASVPLPRYYPLERAWAFEAEPHDAMAIDFYGRCLLSAGAAVVAAAAVGGVYRVKRRIGQNEHALWAGWAAIALCLAASLIAFQLARRTPGPILEPGDIRPGAWEGPGQPR